MRHPVQYQYMLADPKIKSTQYAIWFFVFRIRIFFILLISYIDPLEDSLNKNKVKYFNAESWQKWVHNPEGCQLEEMLNKLRICSYQYWQKQQFQFKKKNSNFDCIGQ